MGVGMSSHSKGFLPAKKQTCWVRDLHLFLKQAKKKKKKECLLSVTESMCYVDNKFMLSGVFL